MTLEEFNSFFRISGQDEKELWQKAVFVFDTSSILEMYYYSEQSRQQVFNTLFPAFKDRLWITDHTNYEYLKNRELVIKKSFSEKYSKLKKDRLKSIESDITSINNSLKEVTNRTKNKDIHPFLNQSIFDNFSKSVDLIKKEFESFQIKFNEEVDKREKELKKLETQDDVYESVVEHFKITEGYDFPSIESIINKSAIRFENNIPPGFKDAQGGNKKDGIQRFGDLIIWNQVIELANKLGRPIVFITNDTKEDWWDIEKEGREKPKPKEDLILEFKLKTKKQFWAYSFSQFLYKSKEILNVDITTKTLEEVQKISDILEDELTSKEAFKYWKDENGFYIFSLNMANGLPILYSNPYLTKNSCLGAIISLKEYVGYDEFYERIVRTNGAHFFRIKAPNGTIITQSIMFTSANERDLCIETCKKIGLAAQIIEVLK
jgi:uncharacterized protein YegP (UPF0339 family)